MMCSMDITVAEAIVLPPFTPNDYFFETYGSSKEKWETYAEAVRDLMCEQADLKKCDQTFKDLNEYQKYMRGQTDDKPWVKV